MSQPLRVLIVEDRPSDAELVVRELRRAGFHFEWTRVDTEADYAANLRPDLDVILTDYSMPDFSAPRALTMLKERGLDIPLIIVSGTIGEETAVAAIKEGAADYIIKDRIGRLGQAVSRAMEDLRLRAKHEQVEETLQRLGDQSTSILNSVSEGVHGISLDGLITFENPSSAAMLGHEIADLIGQPAHSTMHHTRCDGTPYPQSECPIYATLRDGLVRHVTGEFFWRKDGTSFPVEYTCAPLRDKDGGIIGSTVVFTDNTECKRVENELRQREDDLAQAQRVAKLGSWRYDIASNKVRWSDELFRIFGIEQTGFDGTFEAYLTCVLSDDRPKVLQANAEAAARGISFDIEYRIQTRSGDLKTIREIGRAKKDAGGKLLELFGTAQDITEHKRAIERIAEQAALIDQTHDAIMVRDIEGLILFWSRGAEHLYGYSGTEAIGRKASELLYCGETPKYDVALAAAIARGEWSGELQQVLKDGRNVTVESRWTLMRDEQGKPKSILSINTDVTEKKNMEAQFLRAQRMEGIGTLASGVAHDLNNILAPILMAAPVLRGELAPDQRDRILDNIETSAQRGADIVRQVLTFARGIEGARVLVQPSHLIKEMADIAQQTFPKSIAIRMCYHERVWPLEGDPTQLHQVLLNLCINARDAMPKGGELNITVENFTVDEQYARMMTGSRPGPYVIIAVSDTGTGIPREIVDKIFDPFFTTKEMGRGTGLGLSTVIGIVKSHGGFVTVDSQLGCGTTFKVFLPSTEGEGIAVQPAEAISPPPGHGELVLVVDDEKSILQITQTVLEKYGYRVLAAADGTDALTLFAQQMNEIKIVLTDVMMPFMDGGTLVRLLNRMSPQTPVIACSGDCEEVREAELKGLGVKTLLRKPYTAEKLLTTLHGVLNGKANE